MKYSTDMLYVTSSTSGLPTVVVRDVADDISSTQTASSVNNTDADWLASLPTTVSSDQYARLATVGNVVASLLLAVVALSGFVLNLFVVIAVLSNRYLRRRVAEILCCHLAIIGLLWCVTVLPLSIASAATSAVTGRSSFSHGSFCIAYGYLRSTAAHVVVWTVAALGYDKYRTIMAPLHHIAEADYRQVGVALMAVWIGSLSLASPPLFAVSAVGGYGYMGSVSACSYLPPQQALPSAADSRSPATAAVIYVTFVVTIGFLLPFSVVAHCYFRIYHVARWHRRRIAAMTAVVNVITLSVGVPMVTRGLQQQPAVGSNQQELLVENGSAQAAPDGSAPETGGTGESVRGRRKWKYSSSTRALITVLGSFLLCYAPYYVLQLASACLALVSFGVRSASDVLVPSPAVVAVADLLLLASPLANALVYGMRNRVLVKSFRSTVRSSALKDRWSRATNTMAATRV